MDSVKCGNHRAGLKIVRVQWRWVEMQVKELYKLLERDYVLNGRTSLASSKHHVRRGLARFGEMDAESVTSADIEQYQHDRLAQGAARQTINNETGYLRRGFKLALRHGKIAKAPLITNLRVQNARSGFLRVDDFHRLKTILEVTSPIAGELLPWLFFTGWRSQEIMGLRWDEVDVENGVVQLPAHRSKNRSPRRIKLPLLLHESLRRRWLERNGPRVFHRQGAPVRSIRRAWHRARKELGRPGLLLHDLRRSFCLQAIMAGVPETLVMLLGGWRGATTLHRYLVYDEGEIERALSRIVAYGSEK